MCNIYIYIYCNLHCIIIYIYVVERPVGLVMKFIALAFTNVIHWLWGMCSVILYCIICM